MEASVLEGLPSATGSCRINALSRVRSQSFSGAATVRVLYYVHRGDDLLGGGNRGLEFLPQGGLPGSTPFII